MSKIQRVSANTEGTDYICGDIHGCWDNVEAQLAYINFNYDTDRLFCVGDLCDRGPASHKASEYLAKPWFFSTFGNHEELLCKSANEISNKRAGAWSRGFYMNGGNWAAAHSEQFHIDLADELKKLPFAIELELTNGKTVGLVHAEILNHNWSQITEKLETIDSEDFNASDDDLVHMLIWGRTKVKYAGFNDIVEGIDHVFHGHSIVKEVYTKGNCSYIDTGAFMTGVLTVVNPINFV